MRSKDTFADSTTSTTSKNYIECKNTKDNNTRLVHKCIHDIKNMKKINSEMINIIYNMGDDDKMNIIIILNDVVQSLKEIIINDND